MPRLALIFLISLLAASTAAQITVNSVPAGAEVILEGESTVAGVSPVTFAFGLAGKYRLTVKRPGYETYHSNILIDPSKASVVDVTLSPKTRAKAMARSIFIPGWGQQYADQKGKGLVFTLLAAASVAGYFIADNDFDDKFERYEDRVTAFDDAVSTGASQLELQRLKAELDNAQDDAYDAENVRRFAAGTVIGAWGINLLDLILFFPEDRSVFTVKGISMAPTYENQAVGLKLSARF